MVDKHRIRELLKAYIAGTISKEEFDELHDYVLRGDDHEELAKFMKEMLETMESDDELRVDSGHIYSQILQHPRFESGFRSASSSSKYRRQTVYRWLAGIAALLCVGVVLFFYKYDRPTEHTAEIRSEITMAKSKPSDQLTGPVLRLSDGTEVSLDDAANGILATQDNTQVTLNGNELTYVASKEEATGTEVPVNSIITPKGSQYQVILPDGTKVWLNAATTLTYPVRFKGDKRMVEINGEAFFEIAQNKDLPFVVKSNFQEVEVLGTSFNVSAYSEDTDVRTTLVTGKIRVNSTSSVNRNQSSVVLRPGQQAILQQGKSLIKILPIDTEETISWKLGLFVFDNEEVQDVMKKVSRWYDIEVEYRDGMEGKLIGGTIPQFENIDKLMTALQATGLLRYKMEGGKIIIMK